MAAPDVPGTLYCVCQQLDSGFMIECVRNTGGCSGWVHPECCKLELSREELEELEGYICPLCEVEEDNDELNVNAMTTRQANKMANGKKDKKSKKKSKKKKSSSDKSKVKKKTSSTSLSSKKKSGSESQHEYTTLSQHDGHAQISTSHDTIAMDDSETWKCTSCSYINEPNDNECADCLAPRKSGKKRPRKKKKSKSKSKKHHHHHSDTQTNSNVVTDEKERRRSTRDASQKSSYHVPDSDLSDNEVIQASKSKKRKKEYIDEEEVGDEEEDLPASIVAMQKRDVDLRPPTTSVIEKILGHRKKEEIDEETRESRFINEYYIKWKGYSYLHVTWERADTLIAIDIANKNRIKRFEEKVTKNLLLIDEEEYFSPEFLEVHRILAETSEPPIPDLDGVTRDDGIRYLVKWRSLPYSDCTWERSCDLDDDVAVNLYRQFNEVSTKDQQQTDVAVHRNLRYYKKIEESPLFGLDNDLRLRAYQLEGLNWLIWNWYNKRASILADEMGLGKTIQTLAFLNSLRTGSKIGIRGPFLIVAPLSLIAQWQSECESWVMDMNCVVYHGNSESREIIQNYEFYYTTNGKKDKKKTFKFNILVTTYEIAIKDIKLLSKIHWKCLVVDEAHRLKNQSSRLTEQLRGLQRDHCILLTGTPLQNKTEELWALLNFLDKNAFPTIETFLEQFGDLQDSKQVASLHKMLKPYLLRRVKEDVEKSLPPKEETIIEVELTPVQKKWYRAIYERNTAFLFRGGNPSNAPNLMNVMMELRKCCNHPYLNNGVEEALTENLRKEELHDQMVRCSGKLVLMDKLLPRLKEGGHKILVFSQMVRVLDILEDYLRHLGYLFERLDGNIRGNERQAAIDRFVKPEYKRFIMLLSTKAGGLGLNLTAADTVIIFDSDWNPQNDLQAQARAHRIGQTHSVKIYRLITRKTYEMHMFHRASLKLGLDRAVLTHMRQEQEKEKEANDVLGKKRSLSNKAAEAKEIDQLLKRGAYDVFKEDDSAAEQFCSADIEQILKRSTHVVQYTQEAQSSFSKASFVSAATEDDVDIDDPDFWKKAVGLTEPEAIPDEELILPAQRKRTRVTRFGDVSALYSDDEGVVTADFDEDKEEGEMDGDNQKTREWTINGRDRLQRALMHFGFGRWNVIRGQSGGSRALHDIEGFARSFVLQCGLCCADTPNTSGKEDSAFVRGAIQAAQSVKEDYFGGGCSLPIVLSDSDFVLKLKQGGARRVLIRLDMLLRLQRMMIASCDSLSEKYPEVEQQAKETIKKNKKLKETNETKENSENTNSESTSGATASVEGEVGEEKVGGNEEKIQIKEEKEEQEVAKPDEEEEDDDEDIQLPVDDRIALFSLQEVASHIDIVDVGERPSWSILTPWWDIQADQNLLLGVFLHGYGRCQQILADPRLCFFQRAEEAKLTAELLALEPKIKDEVNEKDIPEEENTEEMAVDGVAEEEEMETTHVDEDKKEKEVETTSKEKDKEKEKEKEKSKDKDKDKSRSKEKKHKHKDKRKHKDKKKDKHRDKHKDKHKEKEKIKEKSNDMEIDDVMMHVEDLPNEESIDMINDDEFHLPEVQQMNRLLLWLLSAEDIKRQREEEAARKERLLAEQRRQSELEKQQREASIRRAEVKALQLVQMDMLRHEAYLYNLHASRVDGSQLQASRDWSKDERRAFCYVVSALGAPDIVEHVGRGRHELTWEDVVELAGLQKSPHNASRFFVEKFLPKCNAIAALKVDPLIPDAKFSIPEESAMGGLEYVDPYESTHLHGLRAKRVALLCLRRIRLLHVARVIIRKKRPKMMSYLVSDEARLVDGMPVWWCPWIHDRALLYGVVKHGIFSWKRIHDDTSLPFHTAAIQDHIRSVFLLGCDAPYNMEAVASGVFETHTQAYYWFKSVRNEFPSASTLETRLQNICAKLCIASGLSPDHNDYIGSPEELDIPSSEAIDETLSGNPNDINDSEHRVNDVDKLDAFLKESQQRRREILLSSSEKGSIFKLFDATTIPLKVEDMAPKSMNCLDVPMNPVDEA